MICIPLRHTRLPQIFAAARMELKRQDFYRTFWTMYGKSLFLL